MHWPDQWTTWRGTTAGLTLKYGIKTEVLEVAPGTRLSDGVRSVNLPLEMACGGQLGVCGKCKVVASGAASEPTDAERRKLLPAELNIGYRLACQVQVLGDVEVVLPSISIHSNKVFRTERGLPPEKEAVGLAVDVGSTTVAAYLASLDTGKTYRGAAVLNRQTLFGADVMSRLAMANQERERLSQLALTSISEAIHGLRLGNSGRARLRRMLVVGNTTMHHLLLKLPVDQLGQAPYEPFWKGSFRGIHPIFAPILPEGVEVWLPPLVGGHVGSDALACLIYFGFATRGEPLLAIDIGTNGEVMATDGQRIAVGSAPAGPAFEGINISCGTRAVPGAIVQVKVLPGRKLRLYTVNNEPPIGITGSGLFSMVHEMKRAGLILPSGRVQADASVLDAVRNGHTPLGDDEPGYVCDVAVEQVTPQNRRIRLTDSLYLAQSDVRELQNAKSATRSGVELVLDHLGMRIEDVHRVLLTGGFGSRLEPADVLALGLLPPATDPARVASVPNAAGLGAAMMLREEVFHQAEEVARMAEHVHLNADPQRFMDVFVNCLTFDGPEPPEIA